MRSNADYALHDVARLKELIREHPWATIVSHVPGRGLVASHYPVILEHDDDPEAIVLVSHVGRPDERLHELGAHEILVVIQGPHGYISPGWYEHSPAVPTWNFVSAHLHGTPEILGDEENLLVLDRLVEHFERDQPNPFLLHRSAENTAYAERIVHGTVGFRLRVARVEAKEKLSQDKPAEVVSRVIAALRRPGPYASPALATRMEGVARGVAGAERSRIVGDMGIQSGNDDDTVKKDMSYSPGSGRETEEAQADPRSSAHLDDPEVDSSAVISVPGEGGPDDVGEIDVDQEAIRTQIAERAKQV
ncbi:FMN-binding negative transcriptional regulator [Herbiconiux liukaitaii]|uniref:FMN-binding negative transcriptional regulator n=1 Tax=Herbiconiux liukaitaii TaxID=3342799 RepID=UPI0035B950F5